MILSSCLTVGAQCIFTLRKICLKYNFNLKRGFLLTQKCLPCSCWGEPQWCCLLCLYPPEPWGRRAHLWHRWTHGYQESDCPVQRRQVQEPYRQTQTVFHSGNSPEVNTVSCSCSRENMLCWLSALEKPCSLTYWMLLEVCEKMCWEKLSMGKIVCL